MKKIIIHIFCFIFLMTNVGFAGQAMDQLETSVNNIISILNDPVYKDSLKKKEKQKKIWNIVNTRFNFVKMAQKTLGKNWRKFDKKQKKDFSHLFARFLGNIYYSKLEQYNNEKVEFIKEKTINSKKTVVQTKIITKSNEIPMNYSMAKEKGWQIYDVNIEGVSLLGNYINQFNKILRKNSPNKLIDQIKDKLGEFKDL